MIAQTYGPTKSGIPTQPTQPKESTHPTQLLCPCVAADADLRALWMGVVLERMVSPFLMELFPCFTILRRIEIWGKLSSNNANSLSSFYEKISR